LQYRRVAADAIRVVVGVAYGRELQPLCAQVVEHRARVAQSTDVVVGECSERDDFPGARGVIRDP